MRNLKVLTAVFVVGIAWTSHTRMGRRANRLLLGAILPQDTSTIQARTVAHSKPACQSVVPTQRFRT